MEKRDDCYKCLYSMYDYDGRESNFVSCLLKGKCDGPIEPRMESHEYKIGEAKIRISQTQWLTNDGNVTQNLSVTVSDPDSEPFEFMHAGHCDRFLTEDERIAMANDVADMTKGWK